MSASQDLDQLVRLYGIAGVVFFPQYEGSSWSGAEYLASVGLPHDHFFYSKVDAGRPDADPIGIGPRFDLRGWECPPENRDWLLLGNTPTAIVAIDPTSGRVYALPEGEESFEPMHRDVRSLVQCLMAFRELDDEYKATKKAGTLDAEALVAEFRARVERIDDTPFVDEDSFWNLLLDDVAAEMW
ncbi:SUKH-4 family immunity protein [Streptomyces sp. NPDC047315]|uniref:SUKH-4 family immunity protein n=1 Tax=Streptomyces sp. NPDC047315 TaxID=3155142 RepID=UPI0033F1EB09